MSKSSGSSVRVGCPRCDATVSASMPQGFGVIDPDADEGNRLRGKETYCESCGHELELYFY